MIKKDTSLESLESAMMQVAVQDTAVTAAKVATRQDSNNSPSTVFSDVTNERPPDSMKRFFVIDWLEQLNEEEMEKARKIAENKNLMTPQKSKKADHQEHDRNQHPPSSPTKQDTSSNINAFQTPPRRPSSQPRTPPITTAASTPWRKQSVAIGNGWNAKGLDKAKQDKWDDALACWEKALEIRVQVLGNEHKDVANTLNNMGIALGRLDRYEEAMDKLERCLKVRTSLWYNYGDGARGSTTMEVAATLHNIGNLFQQMNDYPNALRCFLETKRIQTRLLGKTHLQVARTSAAIGHLHYERGALEMSLAAYQEARDIFWQVHSLDEWKQTKLDIQEVEELMLESEQQEPSSEDTPAENGK